MDGCCSQKQQQQTLERGVFQVFQSYHIIIFKMSSFQPKIIRHSTEVRLMHRKTQKKLIDIVSEETKILDVLDKLFKLTSQTCSKS